MNTKSKFKTEYNTKVVLETLKERSSIEEKPANPKSNYAVIGLYF